MRISTTQKTPANRVLYLGATLSYGLGTVLQFAKIALKGLAIALTFNKFKRITSAWSLRGLGMDCVMLIQMSRKTAHFASSIFARKSIYKTHCVRSGWKALKNALLTPIKGTYHAAQHELWSNPREPVYYSKNSIKDYFIRVLILRKPRLQKETKSHISWSDLTNEFFSQKNKHSCRAWNN